MNIDSNEIKQRVLSILSKVKHRETAVPEDSFDKPLLSEELGFDANDMFFVVLELMNDFKISFTKEDIENYRFSTVNGIISVMENKLIINN